MTGRHCHCGLPAVRALGAYDYCALHIADIYIGFCEEAWGGLGIGLPNGPARDDVLAGGVELACVLCAAEWVGPMFETCPYCERRILGMREHQAELLLQPPDVDRDDITWGPRMEAWAERLARAVKAGLIKPEVARRTILRQVDKAA